MVAVVMWRLIASQPGSGESVTYSDFMNQVDQGNVASAQFSLSANTASVGGELRASEQQYSTIVPRDQVTRIMELLRERGASVDVSERKSWITAVTDLAPALVAVLIAMFIGRRLKEQRRRETPGPQVPGALG